MREWLRTVMLPSLTRRVLLGFGVVMLVAWLGLLGLEVYMLRVAGWHASAVSNRYETEQLLVLLQERGHADGLPALMEGQERLRKKRWAEQGDWPPKLSLQIWHRERLVYQGPDVPNAELLDGWVRHETAAGDWRLRSDLQIWGIWFLSMDGLSFFARPLLYSLPFLLFPAWFLLRRGLAPLRRLSREIQRRDSHQLQPLGESPYAELRPLVVALNRLMARLQLRLQREREFLQDAAHELKTPLAVVEANVEIVEGAALSPVQRLALEQLRLGVRRSSHMVGQLLALARSQGERETLELRESDLVTLLCDRIALLDALARRRRISLALEAPERCPLRMHRESLARLVDNLLDNAIKYSPEGSSVLLRLTLDEKGLPRLEVLDQGPGIAADLRPQVFERFFRLPGQEQSGSGLGLAIVEQAAAQNGARVALQDGPQGRGLCAVVSWA
ncbi:two-component sensor histidine kinase [Roseateles sp. DAIF2]|uniref:ATP-binding protein n=1 Tax=Roseateles sp. DAIF2 TaxID=2714952 RepID=UPI0018A307B5|nr:ATP-binding protein [Roseateles sp. DAIF2]QPF71975.1 two-component sensor histidine kinase [Roseateles sp. DAIF2]